MKKKSGLTLSDIFLIHVQLTNGWLMACSSLALFSFPS